MKSWIWIGLLWFMFPVVAQNRTLGKVSVAELEEKRYAADTSAPAAITFTKGLTRFLYHNEKGFRIVHECSFRIKIYKKEGLSWANYTVPFYVGYKVLNDEMVSFSDAVTYNLEGGQIVKTKLTGNGKFKEDLNERWRQASIAMPNVKVGSVIEFKYTLTSEHIAEFPEFHFQYDIPVAWAEYKSEIPEFLIYKPVITGFGNVKSDAKIANGYQNFTNEHNQTVNASYQQVNSVHTAELVPALRDEPFVDNLSNYRSTIFHELERTRFPNAPEKNYAMTWEDVAKNIYKDKTFGAELEQRQYFEQDLSTILKAAEHDSETEKLNRIFQFVRNAMAWDGNTGYCTRKGVKKAYADRSGNDAEINLVLIAMLNHAGFDASPVLISTIDHGIPVFPNYSVFNYVIASVNLDGRNLLLDATDKRSQPDLLPARDLNWTGRLIRRDGSSAEIQLVPQQPSTQTFMLMAKIDGSGKLEGRARITQTDQCAQRQRRILMSKGQESYLQDIERIGDVTVSGYTADNLTQEQKPFVENFTFVQTPETIGDKIYLDPLLYLGIQRSPFVTEVRHLPVYFGFPQREKYLVTIDLPAGYTVESLPKPVTISTGENVGKFAFNILQSESKIQMTITNEINLALIHQEFYPVLKDYFRQMTDKLNEKIVLKKT